MIFGDDTAASVYKDPSSHTQCFNLMLEDSGIDKYPATNTKFGFFIDKPGGHHPYTIFMVPHLHGVPGIRADTAAGDDDRFICISDVGNDLALPLIPKKATYDNCATHWNIM